MADPGTEPWSTPFATPFDGGAAAADAPPAASSSVDRIEQLYRRARDDANTVGVRVADYVRDHPKSDNAAALAIAAAMARGDLGRIVIDEVKNDPEVQGALGHIEAVTGQLHDAAEPMRKAKATFDALAGAVGLISAVADAFTPASKKNSA